MLLAGPVLIAVGTALPGRAPAEGSCAVDLLPAVLLMSVGFAAAMPALTGLATSGVGAENGGPVSGLFNTTQVVGGSLGLAVLTTLAASGTKRRADHGHGAAPATAGGLPPGLPHGGGDRDGGTSSGGGPAGPGKPT
ncbi:hypothetical protein [Streptomyces antibioticus]|uniref:hypothetical protein n=1 Tax=Streptomyces antibioticus TaxID=1890 RepID=UPI0033CA3F5A